MNFDEIKKRYDIKRCGFIIATSRKYAKEIKRLLDLSVDQKQLLYDLEDKKMKIIDYLLDFKFIAGDAWV